MSTRENGIKLLHNLLQQYGSVNFVTPMDADNWLDVAESTWLRIERDMGVSFAYKVLFHLPVGNVDMDVIEMIELGRQFYGLVEPKRPDDFALGLRMILLSRRPVDRGSV